MSFKNPFKTKTPEKDCGCNDLNTTCVLNNCTCECHSGFGQELQSYKYNKENLSKFMEQMDRFIESKQEWIEKMDVERGLGDLEAGLTSKLRGKLFPTKDPFKDSYTKTNIVYFDEEDTQRLKKFCEVFPEILEMLEWFKRIKAMQRQ